ncbi:MAG: hypothetical protein GF347_05420 [Candidatus Moranbacteria bacterium]|nr:hypothetical protein [Candidatus Moranbacteria bacterium]
MEDIKETNNKKQNSGNKFNVILYILIIIGLMSVIGWFGFNYFQDKKIREFVKMESNDLNLVIQKMNVLNIKGESGNKEVTELVKDKEEELLRITEVLDTIFLVRNKKKEASDKEIIELNNEIDEFYKDLEIAVKEYQGVASYNYEGLKITEPFARQLVSLLTVLEMIQNNEDLNSDKVKEILVASQTTFDQVYTQLKEIEAPEKLKAKHAGDLEQFERFSRRMNLMMESYNASDYQKAGDYLYSIGELAKELAGKDKKNWRKEYYGDMMVEFERLNDKANEIKIKLEYLNNEVKGNMEEVEVKEWV